MLRFMPVMAASILVAFAMVQPWVDPKLLFLDPMIAAEVSGKCCRTYYGLMSTLGVMLWIGTAAAGALGFVILLRLGANREVLLFAATTCMLALVLGFDDAFLVHENLAPKLGIPQKVVLAGYLLLALSHFLLNIRQILTRDLAMLAVAGAFLTVSLSLDVVVHSTDSLIVSLEDGAKFVGIVAWACFHADAMVRSVTGRLVSQGEPAAREKLAAQPG